jgi:TonB dependent receptor
MVAVNIDGVTDDNEHGLNGYVPAVDSVQEFKVVLNPYDASYGRAGSAAIDLALKSGTNTLHGDVYEYARRAWLDANTWQNSYNKIAKPVHKRDQFGFEMDGSLVIPRIYNGNNKTFFLIQYEQMKESLPSASGTITSIPDPAWLTGDFSNATYFNSQTHSLQPLLIYDPLSPLQSVVDPFDGKTKTAHSLFPGNKIPAGRIDPVGQAIAQLYLGIAPNVSAGVGFAPYQNNHYWLVVEDDIWRNALVKIDHNIGANDKFTARWGAQARRATENLTGIPLSNPASYPDNTTQPKFQTGAIEWIHVFSTHMILDNKATLMTGMDGATYGRSGQDYMSQLGFASPFISQLTNASTNHFPYITASGFISLGSASQGWSDVTHTLAYQPNITVVRGQHTMRAGFDMRLEQYANPHGQSENTLGFTSNFSQHYYNFSEAPGYSSGNAIASMLLGYPNSGAVSVPIESFYSQHYYAAWMQDDWKIAPKLTLNLGVRYDLLGPRIERHNRMDYVFNPTVTNPVSSQITNLPNGSAILGGLEFAGVNGNPRGAFSRNMLDIQPRIGFAYAINDRMSIRGGVGEMYQLTEIADSTTGFNSSTQYTNSLNNGLTPYTSTTGQGLSNPIPNVIAPIGSSLGYLTGLGSAMGFENPSYHIPATWSYSLSFQRSITKRDVVDISYSGNRSPNMDSSDNINHESSAWYAQCDVERGGNRQICDSATGQTPNPFLHVAAFAGTSDYSAATISKGTLTRPFPAFGDITELQLNAARNWYNSLQIAASHNARGLSLHVAYTHARSMTAGGWADMVNRIPARSISPSNDIAHMLSLSGVWYVPVGRGKWLLGSTNRYIDAVIGGWEFSPLYTYSSGTPWSPSGNWEWQGPVGVKAQELPADGSHSYKRIRGVTPCVGYKDTDTGVVHLEPAAIAAGCTSPLLIQAPNAYAVAHPVVYWGARLPGSHNFDAAASKNFPITERIKLQIRLDAFDLLNHPNWQNSYNSTASSLDFGTQQKGPQGPSNPPRNLQLSAKVNW